MRDELIRRGTFRTEMPARDRRLRIALDADDLAVAMVNKLTTSDAAVRTDRSRDVCALGLRPQRVRSLGHRLDAGAVGAGRQLPDQRPLQKELREHARKCMQFAGATARQRDGTPASSPIGIWGASRPPPTPPCMRVRTRRFSGEAERGDSTQTRAVGTWDGIQGDGGRYVYRYSNIRTYRACNALLRIGATLLRVGATLLRVGATLLRVGATLLRVSATLLRISATLLRVTATLLRVSATLLRISATLLRVSATLLRVSATLLRVTATL